MFDEDLLIKVRLNITSKKYCTHIKPTFQMVVFCIFLGISAIAQAEEPKLILSVEEINALTQEIEAAEQIPFLNLKVESERWVETKADLSDPNEPWQRTPIYVSCTAWFDGSPERKGRIDVHKQVLRWQEGAAPYIEESYSVGFDGQYGRVVRYSTRHSGRTHHSKEGKLLPDAPVLLRDSYLGSCTGAQYTFCFFFNEDDKDEGRTFSRFFRAAISPEAVEAKAFEVALEEFEGIECIKFGSNPTKRFQKSWWFDPSRGFALLGHKYTVTREDGSERLMRSIKVTELKEVAPGIWWPTQVTSVRAPFDPEKPYERVVYRASNAVANDPNFDDNIFTVPFPDGYRIEDKVTGRKYTVGQQ
jgi:hypothetical protein